MEDRLGLSDSSGVPIVVSAACKMNIFGELLIFNEFVRFLMTVNF